MLQALSTRLRQIQYAKSANEKYNEEFEAEYIGNRIDTNSATLYVHPKDTSKLMFTAVINDGNVTDDYVSNIMTYKVQNDIVESFNKYNIDCAVDVEIVTDIKPEINTNLSIEEFVKKHNVSGMYVKAIYCDDNISKEQLVRIFKNISKSYSFKLVINGYFFDIENYDNAHKNLILILFLRRYINKAL